MTMVFYYDINNKLSAKLYDRESRVDSDLSDEQIELTLDYLAKHSNKIKPPRISRENLVFMFEGELIRLKDYKKFVNDPRFKTVFDRYNKKSKIDKKTIIKGVAILAGVITLGTSLYGIINSNKDKTTDDTPYSVVVEAEENAAYAPNIIYSDDAVIQNDTIDDNANNVLNIEDRSQEQKAIFTRENYYNLIEYYSRLYGINPDIMCAIATQERGVHSEKKDAGGAIGLMQVQVSVWDNESLKVFNNMTNSYETLYATEDKLSKIDFNVQFACAIFSDCLNKMNGNVLAAVMAYNRGPTAARNIIRTYANSKGMTCDDVLNNPNDLGWLHYEGLDYAGDPKYVEHVMSYYTGNYLDIGIDNRVR